MKRIVNTLLVLFTAFIGCAAQSARAQTLVNIDATKWGDPRSGLNTLFMAADPGTYLITPVSQGTYSGAQFTAWDPIGWSSSTTWINSLWIFDGQENKIGNLGDFTNVFTTPAAAFADPLNVPITVTTTGGLNFAVDDNFLSDNKGGISITVQAVTSVPTPEVNSAAGLIGFLTLCSTYAWRSRRK